MSDAVVSDAVVSDAVAVCPSCHEPVAPGDRFCERCGTPLPAGSGPVASGPVASGAPDPVVVRAAGPVGPCPGCGSSDGFDADGFCLSCGLRPVRPRDRLECDLGVVVAVSDKGPRKVRNEDSFALALLDGSGGSGGSGLPDGGFVAAVCDGVSNVARSDEASQAAADAAVATLRVPAGGSGPAELMVRAAASASAAVVQLAPPALGAEPPSCTFLAVRWHPAEGLTVGWLGDCRAYLIDDAGVRRLTTDHSWGTEAVRNGLLTQAQADADERSHAITRWLGADAGAEPVPELTGELVPAGGRAVVVACSDGAWNYLDGPEQLAACFDGVSLLDGARRLTRHAIDGGGHDNITVVAAQLVGPVPGPAGPDPTTTTPEPT